MKIYFTFSRGYAIALCVFLLVAFSILSIASDGRPSITLENEAQRAAFLNQDGFEVGDPENVKTVTVPVKFDGDYKTFSDILSSGGYDLENYKGKSLTEYTYSTDDGLIIHIITDDEKLVGAHCVNLESGSIHPLAGEKIGTDTAG